MATLTLRVDDAVRDELDRAARARGSTVSDLLRLAIDDLLGWREAGQRDRPDGVAVPQTLDVVQRRTFALIHDILAKLAATEGDEDDVRYHRELAAIMTEGYAGEYYRDFGYLEAELTPAECRQLEDILEMFGVLEFSLAKLAPAERERLGDGAEYDLTFDGFDRNRPAEARMLSFAEHLVQGGERWSDFHERLTTGERGNSHSPRLAKYQRMVVVFKDIWNRKLSEQGRGRDHLLFGVEDLLTMIEAAG
ncbi:YfbU family protein [Amycolatopsis magusensis]|uniref:YfbU family protein n=1 Tax=Amycolatopsis magusensis TaxID=882444 RepID=UPI00379EFF20